MEADRLVIRIDVEGRDAQREVEGVSRALRGLSGSARQGARGLHEASRASRQTEANFKQLSHTARQVQHAIRMVYGALAAYASLRTAQEIINIAASFERMRVMLTTLTGSAAEAQRSMRWIIEMGAKAPQGINAVADAFVKLKSVGLEPMAGGLKALVDALSAFGGGAVELQRAVVAIQQMAGKGVVSMEELRQQLSETIPTAAHIMARELGMSYRDFVDQVAQGNIEATSAIQALFRGLEKEYGGASEKMSRTWIGLMNRLRTEVKLFVDEVMERGPFQGLKAGVSDLLDEIARLRKEGKLDVWAREAAQALLTAAEATIYALEAAVHLAKILEGAFKKAKQLYEWSKDAGLVRPDVWKNSLKGLEAWLEGELSFWDYLTSGPEELKKKLQELNQTAQNLSSEPPKFLDKTLEKLNQALGKIEELKKQTENLGKTTGQTLAKPYEEVTRGILKAYEEIEEKTVDLETKFYQKYEELLSKGLKVPEEFEKIRNEFVQNLETLREELFKINPVTEEAAEKWYELQDSINETSEGVRRAIDSYIDYLQTQRKVNDTLETYEDVIKPINELLREQALENLPEVEREIARVNEKWAEFAYRIEEAYRYGKISEQEAIRLIETINQWRDREIAALNETVQIHKDKAEQIKQIWDDTYKGLGDTLAEWIVEFNFDLNSITDLFRFMSKRILSTWIETWIKMQVVQMQATGGGLFGSLIKAIPFIGGLFSGGAAATSGPVEILTVNDLNLVSAYHQGGVVGETPAPMRLVPSYIFNNAPRLHSGLLPNEFPAILERGEVVIPRLFWNEFLKQINTKVDKRTFNVNVNVYVPTRQDDTEQANLSASHIGYKVAEAIKNFVIIQE